MVNLLRVSSKYFSSQMWCIADYILNTPNFGSSIGAFRAALKLRPRTVRVSAGSITPSSHNLNKTKTIDISKVECSS